MATKGAHVFRVNIAEYAREWMNILNIVSYEPSLHTLNYDYDRLNDFAGEASPPEAFVSEVGNSSDSQVGSVKKLPTASWELVQKLSQQLASRVNDDETMDFKFSDSLQDFYLRETTPKPPQPQPEKSKTRTRTRFHIGPNDPDPYHLRVPVARAAPTPASMKRKQRSSKSDSELSDDESNGNEVKNTGSASNDAQRPRKKGRQAEESNDNGVDNTGHTTESTSKDAPHSGTSGHTAPPPAETAEGTLPGYESSPDVSPQGVELPPLDGETDDNQDEPATGVPDWGQQVPQALVLNTQPGAVDSPKIGVWHLPSSMVRLLPLYMITLY